MLAFLLVGILLLIAMMGLFNFIVQTESIYQDLSQLSTDRLKYLRK